MGRHSGRDGVAAGDDFGEFYRREYASVVRVAYALTGRFDVAEEFAQDAFLAAQSRWERIRRYENPEAWVRRVATNRCVSGYRRSRVELLALTRLGRRRDEGVEISEADSELWAAVRRLPRRQAQTLALMYIEDQSPAQVAQILGCSEETVRTHARRGRQTLTRQLGLLAEEDR